MPHARFTPGENEVVPMMVPEAPHTPQLEPWRRPTIGQHARWPVPKAAVMERVPMFDVRCVPDDDAQFANAVRAVATYLRLGPSRQVLRRGAWERPLRAAFGYRGAEARIQAQTGSPGTVTVYRVGDAARVGRSRRPGPGPIA